MLDDHQREDGFEDISSNTDGTEQVSVEVAATQADAELIVDGGRGDDEDGGGENSNEREDCDHVWVALRAKRRQTSCVIFA